MTRFSTASGMKSGSRAKAERPLWVSKAVRGY
jgi:hypothetical protein